ncbi:MAG: Ribose-phosphate pyrophosphokinase [Candidatus Levybacteria bacterium GW2011_GWB1_35_5]|nr:MAG: Ribose-phosphate pyrophosphokinase [Candidatus Levybacteria bacterium GW2011_GWB1_35_5]
MKFFSGSLGKQLALKICGQLKVDLSPMEIFVFADGEKRIKLNDKVVGEDCVVIKSTGIPTDSNYMELFFIIDALKRSGAKSVTLVAPYLGYSRQDHVFREGEDVSLQVIIKILENIGMDKIITLDLHSIKIPEFFKTPVVHLSALELFAKKIKEFENFVLVSPDMGGVRRVKLLAEILGNAAFVTIEKERDLKTAQITLLRLNGDVRGKIAVIVDDILSTGNTGAKAAELLKENGATKVYSFTTHAVFANGAKEVLQKSEIERVFVTDTIETLEDKHFPKLEIISVAGLIANALQN